MNNDFSNLISVLELQKHWWVIFLLLLQAGTAPVATLLLGKLISALNDTSYFNYLLIFVGVVFFGIVVINFVAGYVVQYGSEYLVFALRRRILQDLAKKKSEFYESKTSGNLNATILSDTGSVMNASANVLPELIRSFFTFAWSCVIVANIKWEFFLVLIGEAILIFGVSIGLGKKQANESTKKILADKLFANHQQEMLHNWKTIRVYGVEEYFSKKAISSLKTKLYRGKISALITHGGGSLYHLITNGAIIGLAIWAQQIFVNGEISIGDVTILWNSASTVQFSIRTLTGKINELINISVAATSIKRNIEFGKHTLSAEGVPLSQDATWNITMENVIFTYPNSPQPVLKHLNLTIPAKGMTALVGFSGSGKSTTLSLLLKMYENYSGTVSVNRQNLKDIQLSSFYSEIGYVSQEISIFNGSIEENIRLGKLDASMQEIEEAAQLANIHDFVMSLSEGYKTSVGERGFRLSGGQKQRLAIARALIRKPKLLIFDEATSSLDSSSEKHIQVAIERVAESITTLIVAHRLSTIKKAMQIYVFHEGQVVEQGDWSSLMAMDGVFASLAKAQENLNLSALNLPRQRSSTL